MESFLPSEVARLVYGYLESECTPAAESFLESSPHLKECQDVARRGRKFNTKILGRTLVGILDLICEVSSVFKCYLEELGWTPGENEKLDDICKLLNLDKSIKRVKKQTSSVRISSTCEIPHDDDVPEQKYTINSNMEIESDPCTLVKNQTASHAQAPEPVALLKSPPQVIAPPTIGNTPGIICQPYNVVQMLQSQMGRLAYQTQGGTPGGMSQNALQMFASGQGPGTSSGLTQNHLQVITSGQGTTGGITSSHMQMIPSGQGPSTAGGISQNTLQMIASGQGLPLIMQIPSAPQSAQMQGGLQIQADNPSSAYPATSVASTIPQQSTSPKPQRIIYPRKLIPPNEGGDKVQIPTQRRKRAKPSPFPKLRAIAPKITRTLDNGVEVQVIHTKENPLTDPAISSPLIDTSSISIKKVDPAPTIKEEPRKNSGINRGSLRPRRMQSMKESSDEEGIPSPCESPPSPLFIDIESIKQQ